MPGNPGLELVSAVESTETSVDAEHRLLDGLVGLLAVLQDPVADLRGEGAILFHEDVGVGVDVAGLEREHETLVVGDIDPGPGERPDIGQSCGQAPPFSVGVYLGNVGDRSGSCPVSPASVPACRRLNPASLTRSPLPAILGPTPFGCPWVPGPGQHLVCRAGISGAYPEEHPVAGPAGAPGSV